MSTIVSLKDVNKIYPSGVHAVYDFNIDIEQGEFIVLAGPSGCGKSTTLRMIAGLEEISTGDLIINGKRCNDLSPRDRDIAMVFQNYALYAHMTVYNNLAFSLMIRKINTDEIHKRVMEAAEMLGLIPYLNRKPKQLSGGQRQRVAVGRAIVRNPIVYLLDEPLSNLDAKLRASMRKELSELHHKLNKTFIYVTHDQIEALTLADRIVVMKDGYVQQIATPKEMFDNPSNIFVAGFIGTPPMNFYHGVYNNGVFTQIDANVNCKLNERDFNYLKENNLVGKNVFGTLNSDGSFALEDGNTIMLAEETFKNLSSESDTVGLDVLITENGYAVKLLDTKIALNEKQKKELTDKGYEGAEVIMASRPDYVFMDDLSLEENKGSRFKLNFEYEEHLGAYNLIYGDINGERCIAKVAGRDFAAGKTSIDMCFLMEKIHFFDILSEDRITE